METMAEKKKSKAAKAGKWWKKSRLPAFTLSKIFQRLPRVESSLLAVRSWFATSVLPCFGRAPKGLLAGHSRPKSPRGSQLTWKSEPDPQPRKHALLVCCLI